MFDKSLIVVSPYLCQGKVRAAVSVVLCVFTKVPQHSGKDAPKSSALKSPFRYPHLPSAVLGGLNPVWDLWKNCVLFCVL